MRKVLFANNEYYHVFNRGTDKRAIFLNKNDFLRFIQGMEEFNNIEPIGSLFENSFHKNILGNLVSKHEDKQPLVNIVCYCLNINHYHLILQQVSTNGISKFMHRLNLGYAKYFNGRYDRSGVLYQGPFKAVHIDSNEYLLYLSAYVNLNNRVHRLGNQVSKSSWSEYTKRIIGVCRKDIVLNQFKNTAEYKGFAEEAIAISQERKDMEHLLLE